jgi:hypothetical protein
MKDFILSSWIWYLFFNPLVTLFYSHNWVTVQLPQWLIRAVHVNFKIASREAMISLATVTTTACVSHDVTNPSCFKSAKAKRHLYVTWETSSLHEVSWVSVLPRVPYSPSIPVPLCEVQGDAIHSFLQSFNICFKASCSELLCKLVGTCEPLWMFWKADCDLIEWSLKYLHFSQALGWG